MKAERQQSLGFGNDEVVLRLSVSESVLLLASLRLGAGVASVGTLVAMRGELERVLNRPVLV